MLLQILYLLYFIIILQSCCVCVLCRHTRQISIVIKPDRDHITALTVSRVHIYIFCLYSLLNQTCHFVFLRYIMGTRRIYMLPQQGCQSFEIGLIEKNVFYHIYSTYTNKLSFRTNNPKWHTIEKEIIEMARTVALAAIHVCVCFVHITDISIIILKMIDKANTFRARI